MEEIIIKQRELKTKLISEINECKLPAFIIQPILKDLLNEINKIEENQYQEAIENVKIKNSNEGGDDNGIQ